MNGTVKLGLVLAGIGIVSTLMFKFVDPTLLFSSKYLLVSTLLTLVITVFLGRKFLRSETEVLSYGAALRKLFTAMIISSLLSTVFSIIVFGNDEKVKTAYTEYQKRTEDASVRMAGKMLGQSEADIEEAVQEARAKKESGELPSGPSYPFSWNAFPFVIMMNAITSLMMALLLALFIREKEAGV